MGYTPLQSGLAVTSFALGSAASAVVGGGLVERMGRLLTVLGLGLVVLGLGSTAVVLLLVPAPALGFAAAGTLLVAGIGGGWVISPNTTMTLRCVPVRMAGSAGGALQTGQRIGSAIGTAALTAVFYRVLAASGGRYPVAVAVAVGSAALAVALALVIAILEWRAERSRAGQRVGEEADLQQQQVLGDHLLRGHVGDPGERQHAVRPARRPAAPSSAAGCARRPRCRRPARARAAAAAPAGPASAISDERA